MKSALKNKIYKISDKKIIKGTNIKSENLSKKKFKNDRDKRF